MDKYWKRGFLEHVRVLEQHLPADNEQIQGSLAEDGN
jgi:hypothetical protein